MGFFMGIKKVEISMKNPVTYQNDDTVLEVTNALLRVETISHLGGGSR